MRREFDSRIPLHHIPLEHTEGDVLELDRIGSTQDEQEALFADLATYRQKLRALRAAPSDEPEFSITLPGVDQAVPRNHALAAQYQDVAWVFLVGIGGSNLGTLAVHQALFGTQANLVRTPKLIPVDTVDGVVASQAVALLVAAVRANERVLVIVASKSGSTTETVVNAEVLLQALMDEGGSIRESVVVISDLGSALYELAQQQQIPLVRSPRLVGGRYSVFSDVGLFPLTVLGVPIEELLVGARAALDAGLSDTYEHNLAAQHAIAILSGYRAGKPIHDLFCFAPSLELYGKWFRQLMGESVGKRSDAGIFPSVSIGSTDLHSVAQLYLAGPDTALTTFVRVRAQPGTTLPPSSVLASLVPNLEGQPLHVVADAILDGTRHAYREAGRTFCTITVPRLDARSMGELMQQHMLTMMYLAQLLKVDAFDQPAVELYKKETRRILAGSH